MTDFALFHKADWRDGQMPKTEGATHVVSTDKRHHAYNVPHGDDEEFYRWVAVTFSGGRGPVFGPDFTGTIQDYLYEVDISIQHLNSNQRHGGQV